MREYYISDVAYATRMTADNVRALLERGVPVAAMPRYGTRGIRVWDDASFQAFLAWDAARPTKRLRQRLLAGQTLREAI